MPVPQTSIVITQPRRSGGLISVRLKATVLQFDGNSIDKFSIGEG
jgi:hypothetical protein